MIDKLRNMRISSRMVLAAALVIGLERPVNAADDKSGLTDQKQKVSYSLGINIGNSLKRAGYDVDSDVLSGAIKDVLAGRDLKMTDVQARETLQAYQKELGAKREEDRIRLAETNRAAGAAFLAQNKAKPGVKIDSVSMPDGSVAELQYKVITEGTGDIPKSNDLVSVNYRGTLISGKEFDSTAKHGGQPSKFNVRGVIRGWTEALQLMKVGSKWELYIPSSLAYGDRPYGPDIEPGSTLIFEIELLAIEAAPPPQPAAQPLTSDIIRVPSADELKKGAKIEVIKPEEVEKLKAEQNKDKKQ